MPILVLVLVLVEAAAAMAVLSKPVSIRNTHASPVISRTTLAATAAAAASSTFGHALWLFFLLGLGVLLLEKGCSWGLDNLAQIAALARVDQTLVALVTAGGEWEELAVVIAAVKQGRSALAIGNILGAAISNILGAFSLGLLFAPTPPPPHPPIGPNGLPAGYRYAGSDPETGLAIVRVESLPRRGFRFDHSARVYATAQFIITSAIAPLLYFASATADEYGPIDRLPPHSSSKSTESERARRRYAEWTPTAMRVLGTALFIVFAVYLLSIGTAIYRGWIAPPPDSSDDEDGDSSSSDSSSDVEARASRNAASQSSSSWWGRRFWNRHSGPDEQSLISGSRPSPSASRPRTYGATDPAAAQDHDATNGDDVVATNVRSADDASPLTHWLFRTYPNSRLLAILPRLLLSTLGFLLLALSGYLLASAGSGLAQLLGWSDTLFGLTLLSFLTTLPEKALSVFAGRKGLHGALAGAAAGSNTFLLTLCAGVALLGLADERERRTEGYGAQISLIKWEEILLLWLSSLVLWAICLAGGRRWHGAVLLVVYPLYLFVEMTVWRR